MLALYGLTAAALEVPTGGLADTVGRRPVLVVAAVLSVLGTAGLAGAVGGVEIAAALVVLGAARALDSGPLQAWYVDAVHAADPGADLKPGLSRAGAASAAIAFVAFYLAVGAVTPLLDEATHRAVPASERATVLSVRSSLFQLDGLTASLGVGALASTAGTTAGPVALAAGALLAALVAP